ncbi:MAG: glutathione S-transferase N-terminal domain-containing protein [Bauldia litoralis]
MTKESLRQTLIDLFTATAEAHHEAYAATGGNDPEWPLWYAEHLHAPLTEALDAGFTRSLLVYCLMNADLEHQARSPDTAWQAFYADHFIEHFAASDAPAVDKLALYTSAYCPFSRMVERSIEQLGINVERRDINADSAHRDALVDARGRATVPVLHIDTGDGQRWMPESRDIIRYLEHTYGKRAA